MTHHYCKSCSTIFKNISLFLLAVKTILLCSFLCIWDIYTDLNFVLTLFCKIVRVGDHTFPCQRLIAKKASVGFI